MKLVKGWLARMPDEQPRRGAGVAEVEHVGRLAAAADAEAADPPQRRSPLCSTSAPSARSAAAVRSTSSPSSRPLMVVSPSASAPNIRARCETDLSPGARTRPLSRATGRAISLAEGALRGQGSLHEGRRKCGAAPSYHAGIWF